MALSPTRQTSIPISIYKPLPALNPEPGKQLKTNQIEKRNEKTDATGCLNFNVPTAKLPPIDRGYPKRVHMRLFFCFKYLSYFLENYFHYKLVFGIIRCNYRQQWWFSADNLVGLNPDGVFVNHERGCLLNIFLKGVWYLEMVL